MGSRISITRPDLPLQLAMAGFNLTVRNAGTLPALLATLFPSLATLIVFQNALTGECPTVCPGANPRICVNSRACVTWVESLLDNRESAHSVPCRHSPCVIWQSSFEDAVGLDQ